MPMKIVRLICCGIDVHKNLLVATIGITNPSTLETEYVQESFNTLNPDLLRLVSWLNLYNCKEVCMESTGKYWIPVWNVLEDHGISVCLTHPKYVKAIKNSKTDKKDSMWICDLFKYDMPKCSFIPPKEIRELREITRYYRKLVGMASSEANRYQNCLTVSNLGIGSIFSDVFGKSSQNVMDYVLAAESLDELTEDDLSELVHKKCKNKDKLLDAIKGSTIQSDAQFKLKEISSHKKELDQHLEACLLEMYRRIQPLSHQFIHITEMSGISLISAIIIISEIGVDMTVWNDGRQLASWAGLTPGSNESANKKKSVRITKAGTYLKPLLVQCALSAIKDKTGYFGIKYQRIAKRRGHKRAIIAIARKMLICIYNMILTGETFNPSDYEEITNPKPRKKKAEYTVESAIEFLKNSEINRDDLINLLTNDNTVPIVTAVS